MSQYYDACAIWISRCKCFLVRFWKRREVEDEKEEEEENGISIILASITYRKTWKWAEDLSDIINTKQKKNYLVIYF